MGDARTEDDFVLAKTAVYRKLTSDLSIYPYIDGFYVYSLNHHEGVEAYKGSLSYPLAESAAAFRKLLKQYEEQLAQYS